MASMSLDNTWMQAVDRANKAGRILGEVLEKRVQGERPVVLVGSTSWTSAHVKDRFIPWCLDDPKSDAVPVVPAGPSATLC